MSDLTPDQIAQIVRELELHPTFSVGTGQIAAGEDIRLIGDTGEPAFSNSYATVAGWQFPGYWKDAFGIVHLTGAIGKAGGSAGDLLFTLPTGYRPAGKLQFATSNTVDTSVAVITIDTDGTVTLTDFLATDQLSLDGISFRAL